MLQETANYLKQQKYTHEILVVDDGSKDETAQVALKKGKEYGANVAVVSYPKNRGKGGAVRAGVAVARGEYVLMVDADGATRFSDLDKVMARMKEMQSGGKQ